MKIIKLYFRMLRYRVAIMLLIFFLLSIAIHQKFLNFSFKYLFAILALASSYVAATTINDITDKKIDSINHPNSKGRPLITGEATENDLYLVHFFAVIIVIVFSLLINLQALIILLISLLINYFYSASPFKISYHPHLAPITLSLSYVLIPYLLGIVVSDSQFNDQELFFIPGLLLIFLGRIILKDFRDRKGDALYGKQTFLLKYGKTATCLLSFVSILIGNILIFFGLSTVNPIIFFILEIYFISIFIMLYKLLKVKEQEQEQIAIGIGAKMGNGFLLTMFGFFVLLEYQALIQAQILFTATTTFVFLLNFLFLLFKPENAIIGYRG
jgi:4-hydroxybenzoate polyprenyltransferase